MNKRGFTLIELLAIVVVIGIIFIIARSIMFETITNSEKATFAFSAESFLDAGINYYEGELLTLTRPANGYGLVITGLTLQGEGYLSDLSNMEDSVVVLYNNAGDFDLYVFASSDSYHIAGYKSEQLKAHVEDGTVDYVTLLNGVTDFAISGDQLVVE